MLREFLTVNRPELINRCRTKVAKRRAPRATPAELEHGVPRFLDQLTAMLPGRDGPANETANARGHSTALAESQIEESATRHGRELLDHDFTIEQVVHDYGDLCQSITELALEQNAPISVNEFGILNIRLDNAIAGAVTEYSRQQQIVKAGEEWVIADERLGVLAHEMRNLLNTAILAIAAVKGGSVGFGGATAAALDRSLIGMRGLIDRTLAEVRLEDKSAPFQEAIEMGPFILDVQVAASLEASNKGCALTVAAVEPGIFVEADRHILAAALANLLQNSFNYTHDDNHVVLSVYATAGRVFIDVENECAGLPPGTMEENLELGISRKGVEACGGTLSARNIPGKGCLFTIELPQKESRAGSHDASEVASAAG